MSILPHYTSIGSSKNKRKRVRPVIQMKRGRPNCRQRKGNKISTSKHVPYCRHLKMMKQYNDDDVDVDVDDKRWDNKRQSSSTSYPSKKLTKP